MGKYIRLLRLQDQYVEFSAAIAGGIFIHSHDWHIFWWAIAAIYLSIPAYILNEFVDGSDTDKYSWNPKIHIRPEDRLDKRIVVAMFFLFTLIGFIFSWHLGYFWWGLAIWTVGIFYSLKPIRLKRLFLIDIAAQLFPVWLAPFLAPVLGIANPELTLVLVIGTTASICSMLFPYQLADFIADQKAGFHSTHIILGMKNSINLGLMLGAFALFVYIFFSVWHWALWTLPVILFAPPVVMLYIRWMRMRTIGEQMRDMQHWVGIIKPLTQFVALYLFIVWRFF
jgi:4-hydroxybenzoate polyprenyltransferase